MKYGIAKALFLLCLFVSTFTFAQTPPPEPLCNLKGTITAEGKPLPFATVTINNTTLGVASDMDGEFELGHIPEGEFVVKAQAMGYKPIVKTIVFKKGSPISLNFELEEDVLGLEQVVVTADRNEKKRTEASTIVNTLTPKTLENTQSLSVGESLNYIPGLRLENNCQNCGFTQIRMNGMDGAHSQVLINNRAVFSNLAGVYGLELIPSSMIERIEVVRGGGSALYGSNAVAGTINIITKDPMVNSYDVNMQTSSVGVGTDGDAQSDNSVSMNASIVSDNKMTGLTLYGFNRDKDAYDANDDGFSEISQLKNLTFGGRVFHRIDYRNKITLDFIRMNEERRGGNMFDLPNHAADVSEAITHKITTTALTYERFVGVGSLLSVYGSAQDVDRGTYYGALQSISDYGQTDGLTYNVGTQFKSDFGKSSFVGGIELVHDQLVDKKLGYPDYSKPLPGEDNGYEVVGNKTITDQEKDVYGVFAQFDRRFGKVKASIGARFDHYKITDPHHEDNDGNVFSPRVNVLWDVLPELQWRASYSQGYRAPEIFNEDLHIESSGMGQIIHENDPDLKQETSHSYMTSLDFNKKIGTWNIGFLAEGFYTRLDDAFVQELPEEPNENGQYVTVRKNSGGATVKGVNFETNIAPNNKIYFTAGYTVQTSEYKDVQEWGKKEFQRTPDDYGFYSLDYNVTPRFTLITNGTYTGKMLIEKLDGSLVYTPTFFEVGFKAEYSFKLAGMPLKAFTGIKNAFNSYQDDFDSGKNREPGYIYGPIAPRTVYAGLKLSNVFGAH